MQAQIFSVKKKPKNQQPKNPKITDFMYTCSHICHFENVSLLSCYCIKLPQDEAEGEVVCLKSYLAGNICFESSHGYGQIPSIWGWKNLSELRMNRNFWSLNYVNFWIGINWPYQGYIPVNLPFAFWVSLLVGKLLFLLSVILCLYFHCSSWITEAMSMRFIFFFFSQLVK